MSINYLKLLPILTKIIRVKRGARLPLKVYHFPTNRCNLHCGYCLAKDLKEDNGKELDTSETISMMEEFKKLGTVMWIFGGGEPTVRNDLPELIEATKKMGMIVGMSSNGYRIPEFLPAIKKINYLQMSVDGPKEYHDSIRGKGSYDKLIKAMEALKSINKKFFINCVVSKSNIQYIDFICSLGQKYDSKIEISPEVGFDNLLDLNKSRVDMDEIIKLVHKKKQEKNNNIITLWPYLERLRSFQHGEIKRFTPQCQAGTSFCAVSAEGNVSICFSKMADPDNNGNKFSVAEQFLNLKWPDCDCCYRCYYKLNHMHTKNLKQIIFSGKELLTGEGFRNVKDYIRALSQ